MWRVVVEEVEVLDEEGGVLVIAVEDGEGERGGVHIDNQQERVRERE